ncbi:tetratricopeptide repeat protein [Oscillatoria sp. HE19RPO]|uniref:tetratricopeptide repeat protein n=1 Tax=Oscillatoria sp. HE19RPO TaxID=2954806 RepID=UPI0020C5070E|nr:tetratricopeptide repeat protein [Oscillatoria sp. HE19RPO]
MWSNRNYGQAVGVAILLSLGITPKVQAIAPSLRENFAISPIPGVVWVAQGMEEFPEAERYYSEAARLQDEGNLEGAVVSYQQAIRLNPNFTEAQINLGVALVNLGRISEAIAAYRNAIATNSQLPTAHYNLADALAKQQEFDAAIAAYQEAIRLQPNYDKAYYNMANILVNLGEIPDAISAYQQAIKINPNFAEAYGNLGIVLWGQGHPQEATPVLQTARDLFRQQGNFPAVSRIDRFLQQLGNGSN